MTIQVKHFFRIDSKLWNSTLNEDIASTTYQTASWPLVYSIFDSKPIYISAYDEQESLVGQLTAIVHTNLFWKDSNLLTKFFGNTLRLIKVLYWSYGPIIHDKERFNEILEKILNYLNDFSKKNNITMIHGTTPPLETNFTADIFKKNNYSHQPWATYLIDLNQKPDELFESFNKKVRYDIRKSNNENFEFEVVTNRQSFDDFMQMRIKQKIQSGKKPSTSKLFYDSHWKYLYKNDFEKSFIVRKDNLAIGGINNLNFNKNIVQQNVVNVSSKEKLAGSFLTWNAILWSIENKFKYYDMGGVNPKPTSEKEKKIDYFKSKWGGEYYDFGLYSKIIDKTKFKILSAIKNPKLITNEMSKLISHRG